MKAGGVIMAGSEEVGVAIQRVFWFGYWDYIWLGCDVKAWNKKEKK